MRRAWWILALLVPVLAIAGAIGATAESHLSTGGFTDSAWESSQAQAALERDFPGAQPNLAILVIAADSGSVDDPATAAAGRDLTQKLTQTAGVVGVSSYWTLGAPALRSSDGRQALILGVAAGSENTVRGTADAVASAFDGRHGPVDVRAGGSAVVQAEIVTQSADDLRRADLITLPITAVLLLVLFGSAVGASLPLVVGGVAVIGTLAMLRALTGITDVSIFALNVTTGLGLGLGIDYSLLIVSRYREELRAGRDGERALVRTLQTAGRTVLFSAITVAIALASLALFPVAFLRSFAYAGVGVVALAAFGAVVVLPAVMHLLGHRIEMGRVGRRRPAESPEPAAHDSFWYKRAHAVMRRPVAVVVVVVVGLLVVGSPFLRITLGDDDERVLPASATSRVVGDALRTAFAVDPAWTAAIVLPDGAAPGALTDYATAVSRVAGVTDVATGIGHFVGGRAVPVPAGAAAAADGRRFVGPGSAVWMSVSTTVDPLSPAGAQLVRDIRSTPAPFQALVGGAGATLVDSRDSMLTHLPLAIGVIVVATFVLLFLMVGSVLVPLKTLLLNVLSLSATFGALVFVFQDGHLASQLGFTPTGAISIRTPVLLFCFAFGLSMDYEVFLISRIKEEYDRIGDNEEAVALGLQHTGRLVTSAALLIAVVFLAFLTSGVGTIKIIGLGLALAVLVDAFLIRATLVPALMRLLGARNWWAPRSLRRLHLLVGIWEREPLAILDVGTPVRLDQAPGRRTPR